MQSRLILFIKNVIFCTDVSSAFVVNILPLNQIAAGILIDLLKHFDTLDYEILFSKLDLMVFGVLPFLGS